MTFPKRQSFRTTDPLNEVESEQLGQWLAREMGEGPDARAVAGQRLRLTGATSARPRLAFRTRLLALGGGGMAAAALVGGIVMGGIVVGGIVVGGKFESGGGSASRHPSISAERLSDLRNREPQQDRLEAAPPQTFIWRISKTSAHGAPSNQASGLQSEQRMEAINDPIVLELTDGDREAVGRVELGLGASANVARVTAAELALNLEQGLAQATLDPGASRVVLQAGPYSVRPLTRAGATSHGQVAQGDVPLAKAELEAAYGVQWAPRAGALRVEVTRGEVEVIIAAGAERHVVSAGKSLNLVTPESLEAARPRRTNAEPPKSQRAPVTEPSVAPTPLQPKEAPPLTEPSAVVAANSAAQSLAPASAAPAQWRRHAENGQYAAAVREAERVGFGTLEQNASASDLLLLADVARLGGAPQRARSVLTSLRSRYPGHTNSAVAAFTLGRMAQEHEHDDRRAIQWYRTYLKEEPRGRMAEGARARLLKATLRVGSEAERDQAARDYLANHPTGSSAAVARSVLSK